MTTTNEVYVFTSRNCDDNSIKTMVCKTKEASIEILNKTANADAAEHSKSSGCAVTAFDMADTEDFLAKKVSGYHLRPTTTTTMFRLTYIRKKPDGYLLSGAVRISHLFEYSITPATEYISEAEKPVEEASSESSSSSSSSSSESSSESSESESDSEPPVCACGKGTVHFHAKTEAELSKPVVNAWTEKKRRRNRNRRGRK